MYYAGIGSRETPDNILQGIELVAQRLKSTHTLRSGGADGADTAFEKGAGMNKEIYLPWKGFNGHQSPYYNEFFAKEIQQKQIEYGRKYHPAFDRLGSGAKNMMRRNAHQILGVDSITPVEFVVCWTSNGKDKGGTGFAIRMAWDLGIPVYNVYNEKDRLELFKDVLNK
tara:strand:- start:55 stop:561 length:507 start_codon:yes stop_codon:yes gene_type:complete